MDYKLKKVWVMKKAQTIEDIYSVFAHEKFLKSEDEAFYVDLYLTETKRFITALKHNQIPSKSYFVAGQSGNGKSTLLNLLTKKHPELNDQYEFHYIAGRTIFLYEDIDIIDVLLMIGNKLTESSNSLKTRYFEKLQKLKDVKTGVYEESTITSNKSDEALSAGAKISIGAKFFAMLSANANFEASYKINEEIRKDARRFFKIQRKELIDLTNDIILEYRKEKSNGKELIIVIDDLEKKENIDELFLKDMPLLNELNIVKIIAMPIHLKRNNTFSNSDTREFGLKLKHHDGTDNTRDLDLLREVILKRLENTSLITDEAISLAIEYSGANLRQLIKIIHFAAEEALAFDAPIITDKEVNTSIERLQRDFSSQVMSMKTFLNEIKVNKHYLNDNEENLKNIAKATKMELVFAYFNGDFWYDINPIIEKALDRYLA